MKKNKSTKTGEERRRARRTSVQESFNLFLVVPDRLGMVRIYMRDISALGLSFRTEVETDFRADEKLKVRLYFNPAFYLPLDCRVVRVAGGDVAVEFVGNGPAETVVKLQDFLDAAAEHGVLVE